MTSEVSNEMAEEAVTNEVESSTPEATGDLPPASVTTTTPHMDDVIGSSGLTETVEHQTAAPQADNTMPQLKTEYAISQVFWLFVTFLALWAILSRSVIPRIHDLLENRQTKISHDLDRAEKLRAEAEAAKENYERALVDSRAKAQALIAESSALMEKSAAARHAELTSKIEKQVADADANIAAAKAEALSQLTPVAKELTQEIVEKLTGKSLKPAEVSSVIDSLTKEEKKHAA